MNVTQDARTGRVTLTASIDEGLAVDDSTDPVWSATLDHSDALALARNLTEQHPGLHLFPATGAMTLDRDEANVQYAGTSWADTPRIVLALEPDRRPDETNMYLVTDVSTDVASLISRAIGDRGIPERPLR